MDVFCAMRELAGISLLATAVRLKEGPVEVSEVEARAGEDRIAIVSGCDGCFHVCFTGWALGVTWAGCVFATVMVSIRVLSLRDTQGGRA